MPARRAPMRKDDLLTLWDFIACGLAVPIAALLLETVTARPGLSGDLAAPMAYGLVLLALVNRLLGPASPVPLTHRDLLLSCFRRAAWLVLALGMVIFMMDRAAEIAVGTLSVTTLILFALLALPRIALLRCRRWPLRA